MAVVKHGDMKFYIGDSEQKPDAELTYVPTGDDQITIDHTEVSEELRGEGVGKELVAAAVKYAREHQKTIVPVCPYARKVIEETPEYQDVLNK